MVIRTEYRGTRYCKGSSDPLPTGFEIRFVGLIFQATRNGYLMRLTNREELRAAPGRVRPGPRCTHNHDAVAHRQRCRGPVNTTTSPLLRPAFAPGAVRAAAS
jgi:hypothetical protein